MKMNTIKIQVVLGIAVLTQMGCNGGQPRFGQTLYPSIATTQEDHSPVGNGLLPSSYNNPANQNGLYNNNNAAGNYYNNRQQQLQGNANLGNNGSVNNGVGGGNASVVNNVSNGAPSKPVTFKVDLSGEPLWSKNCRSAGGDPDDATAVDSDGDGISDACETLLANNADATLRLPALDPHVFNGAVMSTKRFYKEGRGIWGAKKAETSGSSILLTKEENSIWKSSKALGEFGSEVDSKFDRESTKKFVALASAKGSNDLLGLKKLFKINQAEKNFEPNFQIISGMKAKERDATHFSSAADQYGLIRGDKNEMVPFALSDDGETASDLSGVTTNVSTLRQDAEFLYLAETNIIIPTGGLELRVGNLTSDRTSALAGSKSGMFFVINNNNSIIVTSDLIKSNITDADLKKSRGTISKPSNCATAHIVIAYFADDKSLGAAKEQAIFAENVFYQVKTNANDKDNQTWKPIPQEWMRVAPLAINASSKCDTSTDNLLFDDLASAVNSTQMAAPLKPADGKGDKSLDGKGDKSDISAQVQAHFSELESSMSKYSSSSDDKNKVDQFMKAYDSHPEVKKALLPAQVVEVEGWKAAIANINSTASIE